MRIAVDGRHLGTGRGVARYSSTLLDALRRDFGNEDWRIVGRGSRVSSLSAAALGRPRLDRRAGGADVVWAPAPSPLAVSPGVQFVMTVLDLSWIERAADFTAYERVWHAAMRFERLLRRADRVICVSRATADVLVSRFGNEDKVRIVPSGPGVRHLSRAGDALGDEPPYFLVVGALEPRKAPDVALRAHALARARGLEAEMVFAGDGRVAVEGEGVRVVRGASDVELSALYAGALAVVHPALLEGFGYPPIEGLAHGVPAIVADLPVYEETIGEGALRTPPGDEHALSDALLRLAGDEDLRVRLVAAGREAITPLSWERAAHETHAVLAEAVR